MSEFPLSLRAYKVGPGDSVDCVICQQPLNGTDDKEYVRHSTCNTAIHISCMRRWIETQENEGLTSKCPHCMLVLTAKNDFQTAPASQANSERRNGLTIVPNDHAHFPDVPEAQPGPYRRSSNGPSQAIPGRKRLNPPRPWLSEPDFSYQIPANLFCNTTIALLPVQKPASNQLPHSESIGGNIFALIPNYRREETDPAILEAMVLSLEEADRSTLIEAIQRSCEDAHPDLAAAIARSRDDDHPDVLEAIQRSLEEAQLEEAARRSREDVHPDILEAIARSREAMRRDEDDIEAITRSLQEMHLGEAEYYSGVADATVRSWGRFVRVRQLRMSS